VGDEKAGNDEYQTDHMRLIFSEGLSFSGFERDRLFLNLEGHKFKDISGVSGIDSILDGRAAVLADFDNDGDLDVFLTTIQGEGHLLFRNNVGQNNNFVRIALEGTASGKDAFGAIVRLKTSHGILTRVKSGGSGFLAQHDPRLLFGLGTKEGAEWIEVAWPSGKVQRLGSVEAGASLKIVEGSDNRQIVAEKSTRLPDPLSREEGLWRKLKIKKGSGFPHLELRPVQEDEKAGDFALREGVSYFLNLWATWCGPCRMEMPELQKLLPEFKAKRIQLVGISLDKDVGPPEVKEFAEKLGVSYPLYMIDEKSMGEIFGEEVFIPLSIFIDEEGRVVEVFSGWNAQSEQRIHKLLNLTKSHSR